MATHKAGEYSTITERTLEQTYAIPRSEVPPIPYYIEIKQISTFQCWTGSGGILSRAGTMRLPEQASRDHRRAERDVAARGRVVPDGAPGVLGELFRGVSFTPGSPQRWCLDGQAGRLSLSA